MKRHGIIACAFLGAYLLTGCGGTPASMQGLMNMTEDGLAALNRGKDYFAEGKYDEAIQEFDKAIAINKDLSEAWFYRGWAYIDKGNYARAIADYTAALRINPNHAEALNGRGSAYGNKGDYDRAIADFSAAIRLDPANQNYRNNLQRAQDLKAGRR